MIDAETDANRREQLEFILELAQSERRRRQIAREATRVVCPNCGRLAYREDLLNDKTLLRCADTEDILADVEQPFGHCSRCVSDFERWPQPLKLEQFQKAISEAQSLRAHILASKHIKKADVPLRLAYELDRTEFRKLPKEIFDAVVRKVIAGCSYMNF